MTHSTCSTKQTSKTSKTVSELRVALDDMRNMVICKLKQPLLWDSYYAALRDPKTKSVVRTGPLIQKEVIAEFEKKKTLNQCAY